MMHVVLDDHYVMELWRVISLAVHTIINDPVHHWHTLVAELSFSAVNRHIQVILDSAHCNPGAEAEEKQQQKQPAVKQNCLTDSGRGCRFQAL